MFNNAAKPNGTFCSVFAVRLEDHLHSVAPNNYPCCGPSSLVGFLVPCLAWGSENVLRTFVSIFVSCVDRNLKLLSALSVFFTLCCRSSWTSYMSTLPLSSRFDIFPKISWFFTSAKKASVQKFTPTALLELSPTLKLPGQVFPLLASQKPTIKTWSVGGFWTGLAAHAAR